MINHNTLRDSIREISSYKKLVELKREISSLKGKLNFTVFADLQSRIDEKIKTFEFPMCDQAKVRVVYSNGLSKLLEQRECEAAMSMGVKFSDYIFSKYVSAKDFMLESKSVIGTYERKASDGLVRENLLTTEVEFAPSSEKTVPENFQKRVDFMIQKMDRLEKMYNENIPKIVEGINDLKNVVDQIYKKVNKDEKK